jgi:hypothetical protein
MTDVDKTNFDNAVKEYYKLKSEYEENITKDKAKIKNNRNLSLKEKQTMIRDLKNKCVNCNKPGGTLFKIKYDGDSRHLIAMCNADNKCSLNINISLGYTYALNEQITEDLTDLQNYRNKMIQFKNDVVYGYITQLDAEVNFNHLKERMNQITSNYEFDLKRYLNIAENEENSEQVNLELKRLYDQIKDFNNIIDTYKKDSKPQLITDAIELYIESILPTTNKIRDIKYSYSRVEYKPSEGVFRLVQLPTTIEDLEVEISGEQGVISAITEDETSNNDKDKPIKKHRMMSMVPEGQSLEDFTESNEEEMKDKEIISIPSPKNIDDSSDEDDNESEYDSEDDVQPKITILPETIKLTNFDDNLDDSSDSSSFIPPPPPPETDDYSISD